jgi:sugar (glycoside-pentoside-hexuronide) transporter
MIEQRVSKEIFMAQVVSKGWVEGDPQRPNISLLRRIGYAGGDIGGNLGNSMILGYLMIFMTDVAGIGPALVGTVFLVGKLWDAINDPIVGALADHTNTRWGRYRPWVLFGAVPFALICIATFTTNLNWSYGVRAWWAFGTYFIQVLAYTCVNIPFSAQTAVMTLDPVMRGKIAGVRVSGTFFAMIVLSFCTLRIVEWAKNTTGSEARGYQLAAIIFSCLSIPFFVWCFFSNKEVVKIEHKKMHYKDMYKTLRNNAPFWQLFFMSLFGAGLQGGIGSLKVYYFRYVVGDMIALANDMTIGSIFGFLGCLSSSFWVSRYEKHKVLYIGFFCGAFFSIVAFFIPINTIWGLYMYYAVDVFRGYFGGLTLATQFGIFPDATEYTRYHHGIYASGFLSSLINFAYKFGAALMLSCSGWLLAAVGFVANQEQTPFTLMAIRAHHFVGAAFALAAGIIMTQYKLDRKTYTGLVEKLERGEYAPGVATQQD